MNKDKVYFDYNIYDKLAKGIITLPDNYAEYARIYVSVAHAEEFFNALENNHSKDNQEYLKKMELLFTHDLNNEGVLNPRLEGVVNVKEKFEDAMIRVHLHDTRKTIEENAESLHQYHKAAYEAIREKDEKSINNSNLSYKDIWKRKEVIDEIKKFREKLELRNRTTFIRLLKDYSPYEAYIITVISYLEPFDLKQNIFKDKCPKYYELEFLLEFLQDILNNCGYCGDKSAKKVKSGIYDTQHAINASYCKYFVTDDNKLIKRLNATYYYLGLETRCKSFEDWCKLYKDQLKSKTGDEVNGK